MIRILHIPSGKFLTFQLYEYGVIRNEIDFSKTPNSIYETVEDFLESITVYGPGDFFSEQGLPKDTVKEELEVMYE